MLQRELPERGQLGRVKRALQAADGAEGEQLLRRRAALRARDEHNDGDVQRLGVDRAQELGRAHVGKPRFREQELEPVGAATVGGVRAAVARRLAPRAQPLERRRATIDRDDRVALLPQRCEQRVRRRVGAALRHDQRARRAEPTGAAGRGDWRRWRKVGVALGGWRRGARPCGVARRRRGAEGRRRRRRRGGGGCGREKGGRAAERADERRAVVRAHARQHAHRRRREVVKRELADRLGRAQIIAERRGGLCRAQRR